MGCAVRIFSDRTLSSESNNLHMMKDILTQVSQVPREMGGIGQHDEVLRIRSEPRNRLLALRLEHPAIKVFPCVSVRMKPIPSEEQLALNEPSQFRK